MGRSRKPGEQWIRTVKGADYLFEKRADGSTVKLQRITPYIDARKTNKLSKVVHNPKEGIPTPVDHKPLPTKNKPPGENTLKGLKGSKTIHIAEASRQVEKVERRDMGQIKTWVIRHKKPTE